ncbi:hypothetical protein Bhyg_11389 [Pseudolycoriella hygida]|uniref:Uncharacterized protein n=1 Tax=Pseudolycoriella hygida TaxID=35572 RepID=A0A9Q0MXV1_9DIPT|nr:hypothetical protein Bhyg_11389 [Pseudolycoriella hygida]
MFQRNKIQLLVCVISFLVVCTLCNPMYYKKNDNDKYEPDLIAYSSTVIPLKSYEVGYHIGGKMSDEEYKKAYLKHLRKKVKHSEENPDTLITLKKKVLGKKPIDKEGRAKIESV